MMNYKLTLAEQETSVTMTRDDKTARIYTSDRLVMARLDKLCAEFPETYRCVWVDSQIMGDGLPQGKKYEVHKKYVKFRKPLSTAAIAANARNSPMRKQVPEVNE